MDSIYNFSYGKLHVSSTGYALEFAPSEIRSKTEVIPNPNSADYLRYGFKKIVDTGLPPTKDGYEIRQDGYIESPTELIANYIYDKVVTVRRFSKYRIIECLMKIGIWTEVKKILQTSELYDLFQAAQDFAEDNQFFKTGVDLIKTRFGLTDQQVEMILNEAVIS